MVGIANLFLTKGVRVFVFGLVSIMTPAYLATLGYSPFFVGIVLTAIVGGNIFSNILLTWYRNRIGVHRALLIFSLLMLVSGSILFVTTYFPLILLACFIGNISTTGTEAGPFQSIETGVLPNLLSSPLKIGRAFGAYNLIGYASSSVGALAASIPFYFGSSVAAFHALYLVYGLVGLFLFLVYRRLGKLETLASASGGQPGTQKISPEATLDVKKLSILYWVDAFGGGFVSQSILSYWFLLVYTVSLKDLGIIFLVVNVITALSTFAAPFLAERLGNLRTMVLTHLLSNVFLILIPIVGSLQAALAFLFLRQSLSQMDVPTRQTFMIQIFKPQDRVPANAVTNTSRSIGSIFGPAASGVMLADSFASLPLLTGGLAKIVYDVAIFLLYRARAK